LTTASNPEHRIDPSEQDLVLSALEHDQLAAVKKHRYPRRTLKRLETFIIWSLRIYVLFMVAVVLYQVWTTAK